MAAIFSGYISPLIMAAIAMVKVNSWAVTHILVSVLGHICRGYFPLHTQYSRQPTQACSDVGWRGSEVDEVSEGGLGTVSALSFWHCYMRCLAALFAGPRVNRVLYNTVSVL